MAYVYQGAVYCDDCAGLLMRSLGKVSKALRLAGDSEVWPAPVGDTPEADTPQHCAQCGALLEEYSLTEDGCEYVLNKFDEYASYGGGDLGLPVLKQWRRKYSDALLAHCSSNPGLLQGLYEFDGVLHVVDNPKKFRLAHRVHVGWLFPDDDQGAFAHWEEKYAPNLPVSAENAVRLASIEDVRASLKAGLTTCTSDQIAAFTLALKELSALPNDVTFW